MPPKKIKNNKKKQVKPKKKASNGNRDIAKITQMLSTLQKPSSQVTDLGRMLLHGGNMLGGLVGLPTIFGSGAYEINQNSLWSAEGQVPFMHSATESFTVRHREFIADVSMAGAAFTQTTYDINPGLPGSFPYLSSIARNFQEYSFKGLVYEYKTTSSASLTTGTNTAMGTVMMAAQYRSDAGPFLFKTDLLNTMWSVDTVPSRDCILPLECAPNENPFQIQYVREIIQTGDVKMYDLGQVVVATSGGQTGQTNVVGELWVSYEVELRKPITTVNPYLQGYQMASPDWTNASPFGVTFNINYNRLLGITQSGTVITGPAYAPGNYLFTITWLGTAAVVVLPTLTTTNTTNGTIYYSPSGFSTTYASILLAFTVVDATLPWTLTLSGGGTLPTGAGGARTLIDKLPANLTAVY